MGKGTSSFASRDSVYDVNQSTLLTHPFNEGPDTLVRQQLFDRVVVSAEIFILRYEFVNRTMTLATDRDRHLHLLACKSFFEPFIRMATSWDQMMFGRPPFWLTVTKIAGCGSRNATHFD